MQLNVVQLTTVHPWDDIRIYRKMATSLSREFHVNLLAPSIPEDAREERIKLWSLGDLGGRARRLITGPVRALRLIRKLRPEIVHFHDPELLPFGLILKCLGYKVIYDSHEDVPRDILVKEWLPRLSRYPISWGMTCLEWVCARAFDGIVAATPTIGDRFPSRKTWVIHNYPQLAEYIKLGERSGTSEPIYCGSYTGAISPERGVYQLLEALAILQPKDKFLLAGGMERDVFSKVIAHPGWKYIEYHSWLNREEMNRLLLLSRAGIVSFLPDEAHVNAQPTKLFEYMAMGLPAIASDFPKWREITENDPCCLFVNPVSPEEIARSLAWVWNNAIKARDMGNSGRSLVLRKFNWEKQEQHLLCAYEKILMAN